jgi:hypothetical protein
MSARPKRGPTTAPAIHALLLLFSSSTGGGVGLLVGVLETTADERLADAEVVVDPVSWTLV